ncbi:MAG: zinc metallopeptidase [Oscillospiraceae bacterium]|nr:zinc metallopeptidase [Oscillospiraceae bacterium]
MPYFYWDSTYFLVLIGAVISMIASWKVKHTFNKFSRTANMRGLTAESVAATILRLSHITDVRIERVNGNLTDHYDPTKKVLRLSDSVYGQTSVAALGVAAHECGHAIQHHTHYAPLKLRSASVPIANIGSTLSWPLILLGIVLGFTGLAQVGVFLFSFVVLFQLITLPVEFNASRRAMAVLEQANLLQGEELTGARKVLSAAAMTYVAAVASSILQLLRLVLLTRRSSRD